MSADGVTIGIDIGGTSIKAVRFEADHADYRSATVPAGGHLERAALLAAVSAAVRSLGPLDRIAHVGIAVGGMVRSDGSMPQNATNLPQLAEIPLAPMFAAHLGAPCTVLNDAQAAMHGEAWRGAARGLSDVLMVTLGTGIGAGLMLGGTVRRGSHGSAGEIGAWQLTGDQSFEEFASPANFERRTGSRLGDAIVAGDPNSSAVLDVLGRHIGAVHMLLDLQAIVVGGRIVAAGEPLRAGIETAIRRHCASPLLHDLKVVISALGPYAGAIGAVAPSAIGAGE